MIIWKKADEHNAYESQKVSLFISSKTELEYICKHVGHGNGWSSSRSLLPEDRTKLARECAVVATNSDLGEAS